MQDTSVVAGQVVSPRVPGAAGRHRLRHRREGDLRQPKVQEHVPRQGEVSRVRSLPLYIYSTTLHSLHVHASTQFRSPARDMRVNNNPDLTYYSAAGPLCVARALSSIDAREGGASLSSFPPAFLPSPALHCIHRAMPGLIY